MAACLCHSLPPDPTSSQPLDAKCFKCYFCSALRRRLRNKEILPKIHNIPASNSGRVCDTSTIIQWVMKKSITLLLQSAKYMAPFSAALVPRCLQAESQSQMQPLKPIPLVKGQLLKRKGGAITFRWSGGPTWAIMGERCSALSHLQFTGSTCGTVELGLRNGQKTAAWILIFLAEEKL